MMRSTGIPEERISAFLKVAEAPGGYYAAHYEEIGGGRYDNLTFYLIDPSSRQLHEFMDTSSFEAHRCECARQQSEPTLSIER
ncbi:MAG: hypothetical protein EOP84_22410 [Verrucomicrobiaceae bacterium]|nr:MAG: hypothetical protein EOP84_22410 [Verrucomicrobiaceae bacterium]